MKINVGNTDRLVRITIGLLLLLLVVAGPKTLWGLIGVIPLATGIFGKCALYSFMGISTVRKSV